MSSHTSLFALGPALYLAGAALLVLVLAEDALVQKMEESVREVDGRIVR
jgi:hypothetical protein